MFQFKKPELNPKITQDHPRPLKITQENQRLPRSPSITGHPRSPISPRLPITKYLILELFHQPGNSSKISWASIFSEDRTTLSSPRAPNQDRQDHPDHPRSPKIKLITQDHRRSPNNTQDHQIST
jgi:hypothetical protein